MTIVSPIHTEALGLANLRFFAPPSGGSEFPWLSVDDLMECLALPRDLRRHFKSCLRTGEWRKDAHLAAVEGGIANLVPHFVAQGLIDAMRDVGHAAPDFYLAYAQAGARALSKLTDGLSSSDLFRYIKAATDACGRRP